MEPQIRYVRSADGTRIATYTIGESRERPPVICLPTLGGMGSSFEWAAPAVQTGVGLLAERRRIIWFDSRGTGLSDREVSELSLDAWINDLDAVVDWASEGPVGLCVKTLSGPLGIAYAGRHPRRVNRLILWSCIIAGRDLRPPPLWRVTTPIAEVDFEFFQRVRMLHAYGWTERGRRLADAARGAITLQTMNASWRALRATDASDQLGNVRCPTLVVYQQTEGEWVPVDAARCIAAAIPNARLVTITERGLAWPAPFIDAPEEDARMMVEFLDEGAPEDIAAALPDGTAVIFFADIVDSTAHTERMGDAGFRSQAREVDRHLRGIIREYGGAVIEGKVLGDGVMAVFRSTARAIECAVAGHDATLGSDLQLRIGLHAGDVIPEEDNVYGGAVNIASRISALAEPGEVLVSDIVRGLGRTSAGVMFEDRGEHALKGVADPQRVFAVTRLD